MTTMMAELYDALKSAGMIAGVAAPVRKAFT